MTEDPMDRVIDAAAVSGLRLDSEAIRGLTRYGNAVNRANERFNLLSRARSETIWDDMIDATALLATGEIVSGRRIADIGTGAGLPGLPLKLMVPGVELLLIEANAKKSSFLRDVVAELGLMNAEVYQGRVEDAGRHDELRESLDVVLVRAVASLPVLLEYGMPLLRIGGRLLAMKGAGVSAELPAGAEAAARLGSRLEPIWAERGPWSGRGRVIVPVVKVTSTDSRYPRRTGIPKKRPLGG